MSIKRRQNENHRRLQEAAKAKVNQDKPPGANDRKSPLARRLADLRERHE